MLENRENQFEHFYDACGFLSKISVGRFPSFKKLFKKYSEDNLYLNDIRIGSLNEEIKSVCAEENFNEIASLIKIENGFFSLSDYVDNDATEKNSDSNRKEDKKTAYDLACWIIQKFNELLKIRLNANLRELELKLEGKLAELDSAIASYTGKKEEKHNNKKSALIEIKNIIQSVISEKTFNDPGILREIFNQICKLLENEKYTVNGDNHLEIEVFQIDKTHYTYNLLNSRSKTANLISSLLSKLFFSHRISNLNEKPLLSFSKSTGIKFSDIPKFNNIQEAIYAINRLLPNYSASAEKRKALLEIKRFLQANKTTTCFDNLFIEEIKKIILENKSLEIIINKNNEIVGGKTRSNTYRLMAGIFNSYLNNKDFLQYPGSATNSKKENTVSASQLTTTTTTTPTSSNENNASEEDAKKETVYLILPSILIRNADNPANTIANSFSSHMALHEKMNVYKTKKEANEAITTYAVPRSGYIHGIIELEVSKRGLNQHTVFSPLLLNLNQLNGTLLFLKKFFIYKPLMSEETINQFNNLNNIANFSVNNKTLTLSPSSNPHGMFSDSSSKTASASKEKKKRTTVEPTPAERQKELDEINDNMYQI